MKIQLTNYSSASYVAKTFAMTLTKVSGNFKGTTADRWLHIFDAKALPADTAVPVRSYPLFQNAPFSWTTDDEELALVNGCVVAVSTTEETLTISTDECDWYIDGYSHIDDTGWTTVGDYTTGDAELQVWADSAGPKKLVRLEVTNLASTDELYLMIFAKDSPAAANVPFLTKTIPADGSVDFFFGDGISPLQLPTVNSINDGCTVGISNNDSVYDPNTDNNQAIKATYKAS